MGTYISAAAEITVPLSNNSFLISSFFRSFFVPFVQKKETVLFVHFVYYQCKDETKYETELKLYIFGHIYI